LIFAWLCANGAIWDAAQLFAWAKMFAGYAQTLTVTQAIVRTFDSSKPCEMCVSIVKAKEIEQKQAPRTTERSTEKIILACELPARAVFPVPSHEWPEAPSLVAVSRTDQVPVPPPRA
jgi:hypothetical protein